MVQPLPSKHYKRNQNKSRNELVVIPAQVGGYIGASHGYLAELCLKTKQSNKTFTSYQLWPYTVHPRKLSMYKSELQIALLCKSQTLESPHFFEYSHYPLAAAPPLLLRQQSLIVTRHRHAEQAGLWTDTTVQGNLKGKLDGRTMD